MKIRVASSDSVPIYLKHLEEEKRLRQAQIVQVSGYMQFYMRPRLSGFTFCIIYVHEPESF